MWAAPLLAVLVAGLAPPAPQAGAPPIGDSLSRLAAVIGASEQTVPVRFTTWPRPLRAARQRAAGALGRLLQLSRRWPRDTPEPYRRQLAHTADLVEAAARGEGPSLETIIEPLADDLETKLGHCEASGGRLGGLIDVRVRTVAGAEESANWQVLFLPRLFAAAPDATPLPFPRLSSPTSERLVPGRYLLWARHPGEGRASDRQVLVIGNGQTGVVVDLPVPAGPR